MNHYFCHLLTLLKVHVTGEIVLRATTEDNLPVFSIYHFSTVRVFVTEAAHQGNLRV